MQIVVNDLLTNYQKVGSGPPLVMLHGWGDDSSTFKKLQDDLKDKYTLLSLDLPGFGQTQPPQDVWNLDDYAGFLSAFLKKLEIGKPAAIIAHSNGGALAIRGLATEVLHSDKLILLASAGVRNRQKVRRFVLKIIAKVGKVVTFWLPTRYKRVLQRWLYGTAGSDMLVVPQLQETFKVTVRQDVQKDAAGLQLPVLLIYGQDDRATPPSYGEVFKNRIAGSRLEVLPDAGHFVHHDQSEKVSRLIQDFLR